MTRIGPYGVGPEVGLGPDRRAMPPFASLRAFEAVGRVGGIRKAALELSIDHAAVSRHLRALEAWLGVVLFDRSAPAPRLNAVGKNYHRAISGALVELARATRDVIGAQGAERLLIWCVPGFATRWLAANLDDFSHRHPGIEVELRPTDAGPDFGVDEADGDIRFVRDLSGAHAPAGVDWLTLARPVVFPVASAGWRQVHGNIDAPRDFLRLRLLHEESDEEWRAWFNAHAVTPGARLQGPRLWHAHLTLDAARRGQGVCLANRFLIADDIGEGRLERIGEAAATEVVVGSYILATRVDPLARPAIRKFRDWIVTRAAAFLVEGREAKSDVAA